MATNSVLEYLGKVAAKLATGEAGEHAYRTPLEELLERTYPGVQAINDPKQSEFGAPDFVVLKGSVPLAYIETKDLDSNLDKELSKEQLDRYLGYPKLILTNYIEFRFFRDGELHGEKIVIASRRGKELEFHEGAYELLLLELRAFLELSAQTITSAEKLAYIMGGRGRRLRENVAKYTTEGEAKEKSLVEQYETFKRLLIHDLSVEEFADMYAQTLVYGLFVARFYDTTSGTFTRHEALELIPRSNPFLRQFFSHIGGLEFDKRLDFIMSDLLATFSAANVRLLMEARFKKEGLWGDQAEALDPIIHFYEDFLKEYDKGQRVKRGVYYTRPPIVRFIVRSVDAILQSHFGLARGLADTSMVTVLRSAQEHDKDGILKKVKDQVHRVQVLDPALGTGTFLSEVIHKVHESFKGQEGQWTAYVNKHLVPRLHGFELLMASYVIAHLKLSMVLTETKAEPDQRLSVYLTNSLESAGDVQPQLEFGLVRSITDESIGASHIKSELPIMVVIGNPPYSGVSSNETEYANSLVEKYKVEPGGKEKLKERKHWLNDDYVKFIALAEDMIAKNGEGVVGYITNHGYLENPTFRGMRWRLMDTFDEIYVIDLHGDVKEKHKAPLGVDENVFFGVRQGVAILLAIKSDKRKNNELAKVYRLDKWGKRVEKFKWLESLSFEKAPWIPLQPRAESYLFAEELPEGVQRIYQQGFKVDDLFLDEKMGFATARDPVTIAFSQEDLRKTLGDFINMDVEALRAKYSLGKDSRDWKVATAKSDVIANPSAEMLVSYRPFDNRWTLYTSNSKGFYASPQAGINKQFSRSNVALNITKRNRDNFFKVLVSNLPTDKSYTSSTDNSYVFPLYLYADDGTKTQNLNKNIIGEIENIVGEVTPEKVFDYTYACLYSPRYREKFKDFLRVDFPRVPYPKDAKTFNELAALGAELRLLHLLESPKVSNFVTTYPIGGSNIVEEPVYRDGKVYINAEQYFGDVPESVWSFYIGAYQPAQKWLENREGRNLSPDEINHYQKVVIALSETARVMEEVDGILIS